MKNRLAAIALILFAMAQPDHAAAQQAAPLAEVASFSPQGEVRRVQQVAVRYSADMVRLGEGDSAAPITIHCPQGDATAPKGRWLDTRRYVLEWPRDLAIGTRCVVTQRAGLKTLEGREVKPAGPWDFSTGGPKLATTIPYNGDGNIREQAIFLLRPDAAPDMASVDQHLMCQVEGEAPARAQRLSREEGLREMRRQQSYFNDSQWDSGWWMAYRCPRAFPNRAKVRLIWGAHIAAASGVSSRTDQIINYGVRHPFALSINCSTLPGMSGCDPRSGLDFSFTAPVPPQEFDKIRIIAAGQAVALTQTTGTQPISHLSSLPLSALDEGGETTVTLSGPITDADGRTLTNAGEFPRKVRVAKLPPYVGFVHDNNIVLARNGAQLAVAARYVEARITAKAVHISGVQGESGERAAVAALRNLPNWRSAGSGGAYEVIQNHAKTLGAAGTPQDLTLETSGGAMAFYALPLTKPGLWLVELDSPAYRTYQNESGGDTQKSQPRRWYGGYQRARLVQVTDLNVHVRASAYGNSVVWVTGIEDGKPVADADIAVYDCNGQPAWRGKSAADGTATVAVARGCAGGRGDAHSLVVRKGDDLAVLPFYTSHNPQVPSGPVVGHTLLDRTLFKAGETLHLENLVREQTAGGFAHLPPARGTLEILFNGREVVHKGELAWNEHGSANGTWRIPANAKLGRYIARVRNAASGAVYDAQLQVEEFRTPVFDAKLAGGAVWRDAGRQELPVEVSLNYLSGGAAAGEQVSLRGRWVMGATAPVPGFSFTNLRLAPFAQQNETPRPLTLDDKGDARTTLAPPASPHALTLQAEMQFSDPNGEVQTVAQRYAVWPNPNKVGVRAAALSDRGAARTLEFTAVVLNVANEPVGGKATRFTIARAQRQQDGVYSLQEQERLVCEAVTNARGEARCTGQPGAAQSGEIAQSLTTHATWVVTARVEGEKHEADTVLAGWQLHWAPSTAALEVEGYNAQDAAAALAPADTAQLRVRAPFTPAVMLLTVEREGVLAHSVHAIDSADMRLPLQLQGAYAPNVQVAASFVRPMGAAGAALAAAPDPGNRLQTVSQNSISVRVRPTAYLLGVSVRPQRAEARVRERVPVVVSVRTLQGAPAAQARVTLIAVDDALLALRANTTWDLFAAMTRNRNATVSLHTLANQLARDIAAGSRRDFRPRDEWSMRADALGGALGFAAAKPEAKPMAAPAPSARMAAQPAGAGEANVAGSTARTDFSSLALWRTDVVTDTSGNATVEVPLNDSLTRWRIVAVARFEADQFGTGDATLRTVQPLQVVSGLPLSVRSGDALTQKVMLRNTSKAPMTVEFSARATLTTSDGAPTKIEPDAARGFVINRTVNLKPEQNQELTWPVSVPGEIERIQWRLAAKSGDLADAVEIEQVVTPSVPVTVRQAMLLQVEKSINVPVAKPAGALGNAGGVSVDWKASLGDAALTEVRRWMKNYPFICLEQKTSKLAALANREGWDALMRDLPKYLDGNGLARYFPTTQLPGSEILTMYVLDTAAALKWNIPAAEKARMLTGLRAQLAGRTQALDWAPQDVSVARALSLQATLIEQASGQKPERVVTPVDMASLPTTALVDWVRYLLASPKDATRAEALKEAASTLRSRYDVQGTRLNWRNEARENWWWFMWNGNMAAARTAWIVNRWSVEDPSWRDELPLLVTGLVGRQQQGHWGTTTANVWGSIALADFARVREAEPVSGSSTMRMVGGGRPMSATVTWPTTATTALAWPKEDKDTLTLSHSGSGAPWATVAVRAAVKLDRPVAQGLTIARVVTPVEQKSPGRWSVGDTARVTLTMSSSAALTWVVVRDPVPSGATILGRGLARESTLAQQGQQRSGAWPVFEERAAESYRGYYRYVPQGTWSVEYTVRINNAGTFEFPPARVEAMYAPEIFGETPIAPLVVSP